jgi:hypothetical protein
VRVAALAWEHKCTTADAIARQVTEAERFLHAFTGERVASFQQPPPTAPLQLGVGPPGGTDDPMVAYLHLQPARVPIDVKSAPHAKHTASRISWLNTRGRNRKRASQFP